MFTDLTNQPVAIPGITDSIANAIACRLLSMGAKVIVSACSSKKLKLTLSKICELTNFPYGEIWLPNPENDLLELSDHYYIVAGNHQDDLENFYNCSQDFIVSQGEGLPGRVWLEKQPEWMLDVSAESEGYFSRNQIAGVFGVKTGFAIPVIIEEKVVMIMAFFTCDLRPDASQFVTR